MDIAADEISLFLDLDGTLIDIAPRPDAVHVPDDLVTLLGRLQQRLGGAVAVISGRPLTDLSRLLPRCPVPLVAEHGAIFKLPPGYQFKLGARYCVPEAMAAFVRGALGALDGVIIEEKQSCLTVHFRLAPEQKPVVKAALERAIDRWPTFRISEAKMALELRPRGLDKGTAVRRLMRFSPFQGRKPIFIGDDVTDEDGIRACLLLGGRGMRVPQDFGGGPSSVREWLWRIASQSAPQTAQCPP
ncbi:trehalose-phosphatase [Pedomonas mirosovicensis]|uniref:trehalose-phosphatase n=1 Tax=Pedomonas mirosovicensis TaxID=2908641 RepID=UPI00216A5CAC|nr:trehalose-phosphatase [Pedomonas mirosovicensis]MCH8684906.1 trehalose-phosphatase [Pedomonas mirosovicensis]